MTVVDVRPLGHTVAACSSRDHEVDGIYRVSLEPARTGRSAAYLRGSGREMLRTTILGDEPIE